MLEQMVMFLQDTTFDELKDIEQWILVDSVDYFVIEEETAVRVFTFSQFTQEMCDAKQLIGVNRFDKKT